MAPVPALVAAAIKSCAAGGIINVFAGIPASVTHPLDLDTYVRQRLYFIGTSGSTLADMKRVLSQVTAGRLDTNLSVAAISGLDGAPAGIRAVEGHQLPGKIIVYPACQGLGLTPLGELQGKLPEVAACLAEGFWTRAAEQKLLEKYRKKH
jgi:threonine dehydrogenase-like Zn-dependent dehydrogenase